MIDNKIPVPYYCAIVYLRGSKNVVPRKKICLGFLLNETF